MAAVFGGLAGGVAGWLLGEIYGDSHAVSADFAGQVGALIGFSLIALFCGYISGRVLLRR
jgi:hypothetical protein